jgi:hypothetical protein
MAKRTVLHQGSQAAQPFGQFCLHGLPVFRSRSPHTLVARLGCWIDEHHGGHFGWIVMREHPHEKAAGRMTDQDYRWSDIERSQKRVEISRHLFGGTGLRPWIGAAQSGALICKDSSVLGNSILKLPIEQYVAGKSALENDGRISGTLHTCLKPIPTDINERRS